MRTNEELESIRVAAFYISPTVGEIVGELVTEIRRQAAEIESQSGIIKQIQGILDSANTTVDSLEGVIRRQGAEIERLRDYTHFARVNLPGTQEDDA